jgi:hypothetical protein
MITLAQATQQLTSYFRTDQNATEKVNLAIERILAFGKWKGLTQPLELQVYEDGQITLPQDFETALAFARESRALQPRDPWFRFYQGSLRTDPSIYAADMGDSFVTFRPVTGATALRFTLSPRGAAMASFVLRANQGAGAPDVDGQKFYQTTLIHDNHVVYSNGPGSLFLWGNALDTAVYLSSGIGDTTGPHWSSDTGTFSNLLFLDLQPRNGATGDPLSISMLVPAEELPLNPLAGDDTIVNFSMTLRRSEDQGAQGQAVEEIISGTLGAHVAPFGQGAIQEISRFVKGRTVGLVTLEALFPGDHPTTPGWSPVGIFAERDTDIRLRRYTLPGVQAGQAILALCKKRYRPAAEPEDLLPIDSIYCLRLALEALAYEDAGDLDKAANYWGLCRKALDDTLSEHRNASGRTLPIYVRAAAGAGLKAIR